MKHMTAWHLVTATGRPWSEAVPGRACLSSDEKTTFRALLVHPQEADEVAASARLYSDANRVRMVHALDVANELCVGDLSEVLELEQSLVSHHLRVLRDAGVITSRRDGPWVYYSLARHDELRAVGCQTRAVLEGLADREFHARKGPASL